MRAVDHQFQLPMLGTVVDAERGTTPLSPSKVT